MKLKIGCTTYPVIYDKQSFYTEDGQQLNGVINRELPEIRIDAHCHDKQEVLLHEVVHGVFADRALDLVLGEDEELIVCSLARGLMQVIRDNPKFLSALSANG